MPANRLALTARHIEALGVGEAALVAIGRRKPANDSISSANILPAQNRILDRSAPVIDGRGTIAEDLLDGALRDEGMSVKTIRQKCQLQLAIQLLDPRRTLKISDIGQRLGFSEARSFRRAFVTWTGTTPDAWRSDAGIIH